MNSFPLVDLLARVISRSSEIKGLESLKKTLQDPSPSQEILRDIEDKLNNLIFRQLPNPFVEMARELYANGEDAQIRASIQNPLEIELTNRSFQIIDRGDGLDLSHFFIFSNSSNRDRSDTTGRFGTGRYAALVYAKGDQEETISTLPPLSDQLKLEVEVQGSRYLVQFKINQATKNVEYLLTPLKSKITYHTWKKGGNPLKIIFTWKQEAFWVDFKEKPRPFYGTTVKVVSPLIERFRPAIEKLISKDIVEDDPEDYTRIEFENLVFLYKESEGAGCLKLSEKGKKILEFPLEDNPIELIINFKQLEITPDRATFEFSSLALKQQIIDAVEQIWEGDFSFKGRILSALLPIAEFSHFNFLSSLKLIVFDSPFPVLPNKKEFMEAGISDAVYVDPIFLDKLKFPVIRVGNSFIFHSVKMTPPMLSFKCGNYVHVLLNPIYFENPDKEIREFNKTLAVFDLSLNDSYPFPDKSYQGLQAAVNDLFPPTDKKRKIDLDLESEEIDQSKIIKATEVKSWLNSKNLSFTDPDLEHIFMGLFVKNENSFSEGFLTLLSKLITSHSFLFKSIEPRKALCIFLKNYLTKDKLVKQPDILKSIFADVVKLEKGKEIFIYFLFNLYISDEGERPYKEYLEHFNIIYELAKKANNYDIKSNVNNLQFGNKYEDHEIAAAHKVLDTLTDPELKSKFYTSLYCLSDIYYFKDLELKDLEELIRLIVVDEKINYSLNDFILIKQIIQPLKQSLKIKQTWVKILSKANFTLYNMQSDSSLHVVNAFRFLTSIESEKNAEELERNFIKEFELIEYIQDSIFKEGAVEDLYDKGLLDDSKRERAIVFYSELSDLSKLYFATKSAEHFNNLATGFLNFFIWLDLFSEHTRPFFFALFMEKPRFLSHEFVPDRILNPPLPLHQDKDLLERYKTEQFSKNAIDGAVKQSLNPSFFIGELVKNSLEAGATLIEWEIHTDLMHNVFIVIKDNGSGLGREEFKALKVPGKSSKHQAGALRNMGQGFFSVFSQFKKAFVRSHDHYVCLEKSENGLLISEDHEKEQYVGTQIILTKNQVDNFLVEFIKLKSEFISICQYLKGVEITFNGERINFNTPRIYAQIQERVWLDGKEIEPIRVTIQDHDGGVYLRDFKMGLIPPKYKALIPKKLLDDLDTCQFSLFLPLLDQVMNRGHVIQEEKILPFIQGAMLKTAIKFAIQKGLKKPISLFLTKDYFTLFDRFNKEPSSLTKNILNFLIEGKLDQTDLNANQKSILLAAQKWVEDNQAVIAHSQATGGVAPFFEKIIQNEQLKNYAAKVALFKNHLSQPANLANILTYLPVYSEGPSFRTIRKRVQDSLLKSNLIDSKGSYQLNKIKLISKIELELLIKYIFSNIRNHFSDEQLKSLFDVFEFDLYTRLETIRITTLQESLVRNPEPFKILFKEIIKNRLKQEVNFEFYSAGDGDLAFIQSGINKINVNLHSPEIGYILDALKDPDNLISNSSFDLVFWLETIVHEVAHLNEERECDHTHDQVFRNKMGQLLSKLYVDPSRNPNASSISLISNC